MNDESGNECIIPIKHTEDYFLSQLYLTNKPENQTMRILKTLNRYIRSSNRDIFYTIEIFANGTLRHKPLSDLADDLLITLSLFEKHVQELHHHHAAPSVIYLIQVGTRSFEQLGYYGIARNYEFWIDFLREHIFA